MVFFVSILFPLVCLQVVSELSASYASLVDVIGMSANVTYNNGGAERVHALSKQWAESMTHVFERNRYKKNNKKKQLSSRAVFVHLCHGTLCIPAALPCGNKHLNHTLAALFLTRWEVLKDKLFPSVQKSSSNDLIDRGCREQTTEFRTFHAFVMCRFVFF